MSMESQTFRPQEYTLADQASADARADFIWKTYLHLFGAVIAFVGLETILLNIPGIEGVISSVLSVPYSWLLVLGAFMFVSYISEKWARDTTSIRTQYMGLSLFIVAEAIIFLPLLYYAGRFADGIIVTAGGITVCLFTGLTSIVFFTKKNFSFLGPALGIIGIGALGLIAASIIFGFNLGIFFTVAMIAFASCYILYQTSNILHEYHVGQHVAAALGLFASVALLFWYILQLLMHLSRD